MCRKDRPVNFVQLNSNPAGKNDHLAGAARSFLGQAPWLFYNRENAETSNHIVQRQATSLCITTAMNLPKNINPSARIAGTLLQLVRWSQGVLRAMTSNPGTMMGSTGTTDGQRSGSADQRRHPRIPLNDITVHVTDGCLFATASLGNISPAGICLCNLPEQLYNHAGELTVFSSDNPGLPVLHIAPRWQKTGWNGKTIGAAILNATDAWRLFFCAYCQSV